MIALTAKGPAESLDEAGHARGRVGVSDVAFDGADGAVAGHVAAAICAEGLGEGAQLDAVADERSGGVALNVADRRGGDSSHGKRGGNGLALARDARRRVTCAARAVVGHAEAAYGGPDAVAVLSGVGGALKQHGADGVAKDGAARVSVEGAYAPVAREDEPVFVEVPLVGEAEGGSASEGEVRLAGKQKLRRLRDGGKRGGAGGVDRERGAHKVERERDARRDVVLLGANLAEENVAGRERVVVHVTVNARRGHDGGALGRARARRVARVLKRGPSDLHEEALLRVHDGRLVRREAPEGSVKGLGATYNIRRRYVARVIVDLWPDAFGGQLGARPERECVAAVAEHLPERVDVVGARKPARHADDGELARLDGAEKGHGHGYGCDSLGHQGGGKLLDRGRIEEVEHGALHPERGRDGGNQLRREQRVAADVEKVVVGVDMLGAEHLGPDGQHRRLERRARAGAAVRSRQLRAVNLLGLAGAEGEHAREHPEARQRVRRQLLAAGLAERSEPAFLVRLGGGDASRGGHHVRYETLWLARRLVDERHHHGARHVVERRDGRLNVAKADLEATNLDGRVDAAGHLHDATRQQARAVTCLVHERLQRVSRVGHRARVAAGAHGRVARALCVEQRGHTRIALGMDAPELLQHGGHHAQPVGGELGRVVVGGEEHRRVHVQLSRDAVRHGRERDGVEDGQMHRGRRQADRHELCAQRRVGLDLGVGLVDDAHVAKGLHRRDGEARGDNLAAERPERQPREAVWRQRDRGERLDEGGHERRRGQDARDAVGAELCGQARRVDDGLIRDDDEHLPKSERPSRLPYEHHVGRLALALVDARLGRRGATVREERRA
eukprot:6183582-Pleurochrysis_carterae.AAC.8